MAGQVVTEENGAVAKLKILQHSRIILFKLKFHHRTSCDWLNKSLINPHSAFCSKQIFEQCKKQVMCGTLLPAAISYPPHNHGGDCFPLRNQPCSLSSYTQRSSSRSLIKAGADRPCCCWQTPSTVLQHHQFILYILTAFLQKNLLKNL